MRDGQGDFDDDDLAEGEGLDVVFVVGELGAAAEADVAWGEGLVDVGRVGEGMAYSCWRRA